MDKSDVLIIDTSNDIERGWSDVEYWFNFERANSTAEALPMIMSENQRFDVIVVGPNADREEMTDRLIKNRERFGAIFIIIVHPSGRRHPSSSKMEGLLRANGFAQTAVIEGVAPYHLCKGHDGYSLFPKDPDHAIELFRRKRR